MKSAKFAVFNLNMFGLWQFKFELDKLVNHFALHMMLTINYDVKILINKLRI